MKFLLLAALLPALTAADGPPKPPYYLRVVLHITPHRTFTPLFQEQLRRDVGDQLRLDLGTLAQVEVVRHHELLRDIEAQGLQQALDGWDRLEELQVYFVLLNYSAGSYQLEARAHDGSTGRSGPLVRRASTSQRGDVGTLAAHLVREEFAPVGDVIGSGSDVQLRLKGGGQERGIKAGAVFAVSRVVQEGVRQRAIPVPWALLEVAEAPRDGVCRCQYWHRFVGDKLQPAPGVAYRAVKLPTTQGPVRLRLLEEETYRPLDGVAVQIEQPGAKKSEALTTRFGLASSRAEYRHLAMVQVGSAGNPLARFPVAILDERPIECRVKTRAEADEAAPLESRRDQWLRRVYDGLALAAFINQRLTERLQQSLEAALNEGQLGLKSLDGELEQLTSERQELQTQLKTLKATAKLDLGEGEQRLAELRKAKQQVSAFVDRVRERMKEDEQAQRLAKRVEQAKLSESEADFDKAIAILREILKERPDQAKIREHLERLESGWQLRSEEHKEARKFIYQVWPTLDVAGLKENLARARESLALCAKVDDRLTPRKLQRANAVHAAQLQRQIDMLKQRQGEDARNQLPRMGELVAELSKLHAAATELLADKDE